MVSRRLVTYVSRLHISAAVVDDDVGDGRYARLLQRLVEGLDVSLRSVPVDIHAYCGKLAGIWLWPTNACRVLSQSVCPCTLTHLELRL